MDFIQRVQDNVKETKKKENMTPEEKEKMEQQRRRTIKYYAKKTHFAIADSDEEINKEDVIDPKTVLIKNLSRSGRHENHLTTSEFIKKSITEKRLIHEKVKTWEQKQQIKRLRIQKE